VVGVTDGELGWKFVWSGAWFMITPEYQMSNASSNKEKAARSLTQAGRIVLPLPFAKLLRAARRWLSVSDPLRPGRVRFGDLRRVKPLSEWFGFDRGIPLDRIYVEEFLARHSGDIQGRALEVGDNAYTLRFGGAAVKRSDVLHVDSSNPHATIIGDLADGTGLPSDTFDCIVLTQTLHLIYDMRRAVATLHRMLAPGGVLLVTVPGVSSVDRGEWGATWHWSLTPLSLERLLAERFGARQVTIETHGNVLVAAGFLYGLSAEELTKAELAARDPRYPVIVTARAVKAEGAKQ
jgi:SAM-dependent methyltransferase